MEGMAVVIDGAHEAPACVSSTRKTGDHLAQVFSCSASNQNNLFENFTNFKRSGMPARVMFFHGGTWKDFPGEVVEFMRMSFSQGRATMEVEMEGNSSIVDFLRMSGTDLATGSERSVAWIDAAGQCFFPKRIVGHDREVNCHKLEIEIRLNNSNSPSPMPPLPAKQCIERKTVSPSPFEEHSDESPEVSSTMSSEKPRWSGVEAVDRGSDYYKSVERLFLSGMRKVDPSATATTIHRCTRTDPLTNARWKAFQMRIQLTQAIRGAVNLKFGWYVDSLECLTSILKYGFGQPNNILRDSEAYGTGIHLALPESLHRSCAIPEADDNGERHIILCRVILGKAEKVERGSRQFHPSSEQFDSGVDDLQSPSWYIVWSTHMNTHVIPECVVSFRSSPQIRQGMIMNKKIPANTHSPPVNLTFSQLFAEIGRLLSPSTMKTLDMLFDRYKARKIQKDVFIRHLRSIAGSKLLIDTVKKFQDRL